MELLVMLLNIYIITQPFGLGLIWRKFDNQFNEATNVIKSVSKKILLPNLM